MYFSNTKDQQSVAKCKQCFWSESKDFVMQCNWSGFCLKNKIEIDLSAPFCCLDFEPRPWGSFIRGGKVVLTFESKLRFLAVTKQFTKSEKAKLIGLFYQKWLNREGELLGQGKTFTGRDAEWHAWSWLESMAAKRQCEIEAGDW